MKKKSEHLKLVSDLIEHKKKNDLTQQDIAVSLGFSVSTIARWLAGNNFPGLKARRKIREFIGRK